MSKADLDFEAAKILLGGPRLSTSSLVAEPFAIAYPAPTITTALDHPGRPLPFGSPSWGTTPDSRPDQE